MTVNGEAEFSQNQKIASRKAAISTENSRLEPILIGFRSYRMWITSISIISARSAVDNYFEIAPVKNEILRIAQQGFTGFRGVLNSYN